MKKFAKYTILSSILILSNCADANEPSKEDVYDAVYLYASSDQSCNGTYELQKLEIKEVKEYVEQFGGWKISYGYISKCESSMMVNGSPIPFSQTNQQMDNPVDIFVRENNGQYEAFMPAIFQNAIGQIKF